MFNVSLNQLFQIHWPNKHNDGTHKLFEAFTCRIFIEFVYLSIESTHVWWELVGGWKLKKMKNPINRDKVLTINVNGRCSIFIVLVCIYMSLLFCRLCITNVSWVLQFVNKIIIVFLTTIVTTSSYCGATWHYGFMTIVDIIILWFLYKYQNFKNVFLMYF